MKVTANEEAVTANNCARPPHFPPHCGCPAGVVPSEPLQLALFPLQDAEVPAA